MMLNDNQIPNVQENISVIQKTERKNDQMNVSMSQAHPLNGSLNYFARKKDMELINSANKVIYLMNKMDL